MNDFTKQQLKNLEYRQRTQGDLGTFKDIRKQQQSETDAANEDFIEQNCVTIAEAQSMFGISDRELELLHSKGLLVCNHEEKNGHWKATYGAEPRQMDKNFDLIDVNDVRAYVAMKRSL